MNETIALSLRDNGDIRSDWGIFFHPQPYRIDKNTHDDIDALSYKFNVPIDVLNELKSKAKKLDTLGQNQFRWQQKAIKKFIVIDSDKNISPSALEKLSLTRKRKARGVKMDSRMEQSAIARTTN